MRWAWFLFQKRAAITEIGGEDRPKRDMYLEDGKSEVRSGTYYIFFDTHSIRLQ
jgi:hypothetical protein